MKRWSRFNYQKIGSFMFAENRPERGRKLKDWNNKRNNNSNSTENANSKEKDLSFWSRIKCSKIFLSQWESSSESPRICVSSTWKTENLLNKEWKKLPWSSTISTCSSINLILLILTWWSLHTVRKL